MLRTAAALLVATCLGGCSSTPQSNPGIVDGAVLKGPSLGFDDDSGDAEASTESDASGTQLSADILPFGLVPCGTSTTQMLQVFNVGTPSLTLTASVTGTWFSVTPTALTLAGQATGQFTVTVTVPSTVAAATPLNGSLVLLSDDPQQPSLTVPLSVEPQGATVTMQSGAASVAFPTSEVREQASVQRFTLVNTGNASATVAVTAPSNTDFSFVGAPDAGVNLDMGGTWTGVVDFVATDTTAASATSTVTVTGTTCGTSVSAIALSGQGGYGALTGWPTAPVDFGPTPCGGGAPPEQSFQLLNSSGVDVHVTGVSITPPQSGFTTSATIGDVIPEGTTRPYTVKVDAPPVPGLSALTPITATLTLQTDGDSPHTVTLQEDPQGAVLAFDTSATTDFGSFGQVLLLTSASQNFSVVNTGNAAATVTLATSTSTTTPADASDVPAPPFTIATPSFSIPANGTQTDAVTFTPGTGASYGDAITMTATGSVCVPPPSPLPLSGIGVGGGPLVQPTSVAFLPTCGGPAPVRQAVTLVNRGVASMSWSVSSVTGAGAAQYALSPSSASGMLAPLESALFEISAAAIPSPAPNPDPSALSAEFTITTDVPLDQPHVVSLTETPIGDQLSFSVAQLRFGQYPIDFATPQQTFTVSNAANPGSPSANVTLVLSGAGSTVEVEPADGGAVCVVAPDGGADAAGLCPPMTSDAGDGGDRGDGSFDAGDAVGPETVVAGYLLEPQASFSLAPGGGISSPEIVTFVPTAAAAYPATVAIRTSDPLCSALPAPLELTGAGTQGQVSLSAMSLAFGSDPADPKGLVNCGATGLSRTLTVSNVGNSVFDVTGLSLGQGTTSPYAVSGVTLPASIAIGGSVMITVTPSAIPASVADPNDPSPFVDTLTVTTDAAFDSPQEVSLVMQARGAVIADHPFATSWNFGTISIGSIGTFINPIDNVGNAPALVALQGLAHPDIFGLAANPTAAGANGATAFVGQFEPASPDGAWTDQGTLVVTAEQVFCQPLPSAWSNATIAVAGGSSSNPPVTIAGSLAFPSTECGSAPPSGQSVTLTNNTNQAYAYSLAFTNGAFYSIVDPGAGVVAGGQSATIVVTPNALNPGPGVQPGAAPYADTLVVSTFPASLGDAGPGASVDAGADASSPETPTFTVPISWTLNGAVFALPEGSGPSIDGSGNPAYPADTATGFTLPMTNSGNEAATVTLGGVPASALAFGTSGSITVGASTSAAPPLTAASSDATCPTTTLATATFFYSGSVCQPFALSQVTVEACQGTLH